MNRINKLFAEKKKGVLSVYFTAGYPTLDSTMENLIELSNAGVDFIEVGVPFSDPLADGPVIQHSCQKALENGMSVRKMFEQLKDLRQHTQVPVILMGYINPILQFGFENYCKKSKEVGVDGFIIPDLPLGEYLSDFKPIAEKYELECFNLITPATSDERIRFIDSVSNGFIYMVSSTSTTGPQSSFASQEVYFDRIQAMNLKNPTMVGFGISNKATCDSACSHSSGAIVGSAYIKAIEETDNIKQAVDLLLTQLGRK